MLSWSVYIIWQINEEREIGSISDPQVDGRSRRGSRETQHNPSMEYYQGARRHQNNKCDCNSQCREIFLTRSETKAAYSSLALQEEIFSVRASQNSSNSSFVLGLNWSSRVLDFSTIPIKNKTDYDSTSKSTLLFTKIFSFTVKELIKLIT